MSTTTIAFRWLVNNVLADASAVALSDAAAAFGVRRTDNNAVIVAAGTALSHDGAGLYSYEFTDPAPGLTYEYWVQVLYGGSTYRFQRFSGPAAAQLLNSYLTSGQADTLAASLPPLKAWPTANDSQKTAALVQATLDVDRGQKYQGRKYDLTQALEFPRMAYEAAARVRNWGVMAQPVIPPGYGDVVWDWDAVNMVALVPNNVLLAVIYQADSILAADRDDRLAAQHDGVQSQSNSGLAESYAAARAQNAGLSTGLCLKAYRILQPYRIVAGRML